ncbi:MAG: helix-turn-helix transcriptional regulator, partial [Clostridia bacterium]|nr:helix-turn-helix transcriptional regulator [Clostridia bacterium]
MTQAELAQALGVTNKAVSKWETGEAMPETALLLPISRIFGVSVDELLDGKRSENSASMASAAFTSMFFTSSFIVQHSFTLPHY